MSDLNINLPFGATPVDQSELSGLIGAKKMSFYLSLLF